MWSSHERHLLDTRRQEFFCLQSHDVLGVAVPHRDLLKRQISMMRCGHRDDCFGDPHGELPCRCTLLQVVDTRLGVEGAAVEEGFHRALRAARDNNGRFRLRR